MPKYRIVSEADPRGKHRESRGAALRGDEARLETIMEAGSVAEASCDARDTEPHRQRRIVSIEEIHPGLRHGDDVIAAVLSKFDLITSAGRPLADPEKNVDDRSPVYGSPRFTELAQQVVHALRESGLVPGLNISVLSNAPDEPYAMVEIFDDARGIYLSRGTEVRRLTGDRYAPGKEGALAIARELILVSNVLH